MVQLFDMNRKLKRTITYIILAAMLLTGLGGCATWDNFYKAFINPQQESSDIIRIAILEPLTGVDAKAASDEIAGIELANQLFPSVLGKDVELVYYDTKSNIEDLKEVTEKLTEEDISLVLGCYGNAMTIAAGDILREHFIPAIAITCTNPLITRTNPFYARVCYIDLYEAAGAAEFVYSYLETDKVAVLTQRNNDYSKAKGEEFSARFSELSGRDYIPVTAFDQESTDLEAILKSFSLAGSEVIYLPEDADTSKRVMEKAKELALHFIWVGTSAWDGAGLDNVYFTVDYAADEHQTPMTAEFNRAYTAKYGSDKTPPENAALGFDAYLLALRGISDARSVISGSIIAMKIREVQDLEGATGIIIMNEIGDPVKNIVINRSFDGKQTAVDTVAPTENSYYTNSTENSK